MDQTHGFSFGHSLDFFVCTVVALLQTIWRPSCNFTACNINKIYYTMHTVVQFIVKFIVMNLCQFCCYLSEYVSCPDSGVGRGALWIVD